MPSTFRNRYPPPWRTEESRVAVFVLDANGVTLASIHVPINEAHGGHEVARMTWSEARALAKRIAQLGES